MSNDNQDVLQDFVHEKPKALGEYLREAGVLTDVQIRIALYEQKRTGKPFGKILIEHGWVDQKTVTSSLLRQARTRLSALLKTSSRSPNKNAISSSDD